LELGLAKFSNIDNTGLPIPTDSISFNQSIIWLLNDVVRSSRLFGPAAGGLMVNYPKDDVRIGIDVGGTFTDLVIQTPDNVFMAKTLNSPASLLISMSNALQAGLAVLDIDHKDITEIVHGTTLGTNLLIEKKGPLTGFLTTKGFKDIPAIQRHDKKDVYDLKYKKPSHLVPGQYCYEITERISAQGEVLVPLDRQDLIELLDCVNAAGVESLAVCLLHSYKNKMHEVMVENFLAEEANDLSVSLSSSVLPQFREYERATATVINAYLQKPFKVYVESILSELDNSGFAGELYLLQSNGGVVVPSDVKNNALRLILSGPSGGVAAAGFLAEKLGIQNMITLDMGGTSTDVSVITDGLPPISFSKEIQGLPLNIPMIDIETIGAGGGSIAWIDKGGLLHVGPESAGAVPGPACYGRGGSRATVTDADLAVGLIRKDRALGDIHLDVEASRRCISDVARSLSMSLEEASEAIRKIVNSNMEHAIRLVTSEKGREPEEFVLLAFGGAGPLHAVEVADNLGIRKVIVPHNPGLFSTLGCLLSDIKRDYVKTDIGRLSALDPGFIESIFAELEMKAASDMNVYRSQGKEMELQRSLDMRYVGQAYETNLPVTDRRIDPEQLHRIFNEYHLTTYGRASPDLDIEIVNYRLTATSRIAQNRDKLFEHFDGVLQRDYADKGRIYFEGKGIEARFHHCSQLRAAQVIEGPAVVVDETSTCFIPPEWSAQVDKLRNLVITERR
jgi:N-methylhydantoinase A